MEWPVREYTLSRSRCRTESPLDAREYNVMETRTFTMNPKQRPYRPLPFRERLSVDKPFRTSFMVGLACNVVVLRWVWRR